MAPKARRSAGGKRQELRPTFVLDASVAAAWFFNDESDPYADAVEDSLAETAAIVPSQWHLEVGNAVLMGERRKRTTEAKGTQFLTLLRSLPIIVDEETVIRAWRETLLLARHHKLSTYDAAYLELAIRRGLPLASLDGPLKGAASAVGVAIFRP